MEEHVFKIRTVSSALRPEEAYVQILDTLQHLERVTEDVFSRIERKTSENQQRLQAVNARIGIAEAKISHIKGSKKAIRVFAAPSFPAKSLATDNYTSILSEDTNTPLEIPKNVPAIRARFPRDVKPPQKLEVHPLVAAKDPGLHFDEPLHADGLGNIPSNVKSVSSLLLFNTAQNPYTKHIGMESLSGSAKSRKAAEPEPQTPSIDAAPASFAQLDLGQQKDDLSYIPGFGDVPEFDLPNMLPDLPGVVEDFGFGEMDIGMAIPSMDSFTLDTPVVKTAPELPKVAVPAAAPPPPRPPAPAMSLPTIPGAAPPPPPPPPPAPLPASGDQEKRSGGPPPPPPPGPAPPPPPPAEGGSAAPPASDARSSLLESIRAAGGVGKAKLKSVEERKIE